MILIIYDSVFGNTEKVATLLAAEIELLGKTSLARAVSLVINAEMKAADLLVFGSPTRGFVPTDAMKLFLTEKAGLLAGRKVSAFDTRLDPKAGQAKIMGWFVKNPGYAIDYFAQEFLRVNAKMVVPPSAFYVRKGKGPLSQGTPAQISSFAATLINA